MLALGQCDLFLGLLVEILIRRRVHMAMELTLGELKRLADIGGSALNQKMAAEAESIFKAIIPFCPPNSNGPVIGLAMAKYGQGDVDGSISLLRDNALKENPECADSNIHLALILRSAGRHEESDKCLNAVRNMSLDNALAEIVGKIERGRFDNQF